MHLGARTVPKPSGRASPYGAIGSQAPVSQAAHLSSPPPPLRPRPSVQSVLPDAPMFKSGGVPTSAPMSKSRGMPPAVDNSRGPLADVNDRASSSDAGKGKADKGFGKGKADKGGEFDAFGKASGKGKADKGFGKGKSDKGKEKEGEFDAFDKAFGEKGKNKGGKKGKDGKSDGGKGKGGKKSKGSKADDKGSSDGAPRKPQEIVWKEDLYRPGFCEDPWEELYAMHSEKAAHLRAHLDSNTQEEADREEEKAQLEAENALGATAEKAALDARLEALGFTKAAEAAKAQAVKAAVAAEAAAAVKEKEKAEEAEKATSIYDFFQGDDDGFM